MPKRYINNGNDAEALAGEGLNSTDGLTLDVDDPLTVDITGDITGTTHTADLVKTDEIQEKTNNAGTTLTDPVIFTETATQTGLTTSGTVYMDDGTNTPTGNAELLYYNGSVWNQMRGAFQAFSVVSDSTGSGSGIINSQGFVNAWEKFQFDATDTRTVRETGEALWTLTPVTGTADIKLNCDVAGDYLVMVTMNVENVNGAYDKWNFALQGSTPSTHDGRSLSKRIGTESGIITYDDQDITLHNDKTTTFAVNDALYFWGSVNSASAINLNTWAFNARIFRM